MGARDRIRAFLEDNVGRIVSTQEIGLIAGISDYQRRIRELRDEEGMAIRSHIDRHDLKPGQYILETLERQPAVGRDISPQLRMEILERNGFTCQLCGNAAGDMDPYNQGRRVRLHIDHVIPVSQGGMNERTNLRAVCSVCNQAKANIQVPSESALNLIARIRRMPRSVQREVYEVLKRSVGDD